MSVKDRNGASILPPWMANWQYAYWGCINNPEFKKLWFARLDNLLASEIDCIHIDDYLLNVSAASWGGCYCEYCRETASRAGWDLGSVDNMVAFQMSSVNHFYRLNRLYLEGAGRADVALSCNGTPVTESRARLIHAWGIEKFDFQIGEYVIETSDPQRMMRALYAAERSNKPLLLTRLALDVDLTRSAIALAHACSGGVIVPWDVWMPDQPDGKERYYGRVDDFAQLYAFVRRMGHLLDDSGHVAFLPPGVLRTGELGLTVHGADNVWGVVRADARGRRFAVIHLIAWGRPVDVEVELTNTGFLPIGATRCEWYAPNLDRPETMQSEGTATQRVRLAPCGVVVARYH